MLSNFRSIALFLFVLVLVTGCFKKESNKFSIKIGGSDTEVNLVQTLAEAFIHKYPEVTISVAGGGSGTGITSIINKQIDIANSSRSMKEAETNQAIANGVEPVEIPFALDGLAVITNVRVSIDKLSLEEIAAVFKGEISNWKQLGGPDMKISMYGRQSNSGTFVYFRDTVLKGDYSPSVKRMNGTAQIVEAIRKDNAAIGYVGIGYIVNEKGVVISGINVLRLSSEAVPSGISPLESEKVKSGLYPLSRTLFQYTNGKPRENILKFIQFELSEEGQSLITKEGYYPLTQELMRQNHRLSIIK